MPLSHASKDFVVTLGAVMSLRVVASTPRTAKDILEMQHENHVRQENWLDWVIWRDRERFQKQN